MARAAAGKSGGTSRVRFVMMEAEIADGSDLAQFTQAMQNALSGPRIATVHRLAPPAKAVVQDVNRSQAEEPEAEIEVQGEVEEVSNEGARQRAPRKPAPTPQVLSIDLTTEPSIATYAQKANPESHLKRYLVIAAWFKEHRNIDAITSDHVYTCYRSFKWPLDIKDFGQPLRDLKFKQLFTSPEKGSYAINHLGLQEVGKLNVGTK